MSHLPKAPLAAALLALALPIAAGCSSSNATSTTTTAPATPTTAPAGLAATGSVDGFTLSVTCSPVKGTVGHTAIVIRAVLKGTVKPATLIFEVSDRASAVAGPPATQQRVAVRGAGTYTIPTPFSPASPGAWASTVIFQPARAGASKLTVSGLPPVAGSSAPFPQLITVVTAA